MVAVLLRERDESLLQQPKRYKILSGTLISATTYGQGPGAEKATSRMMGYIFQEIGPINPHLARPTFKGMCATLTKRVNNPNL